MSSCAPSKQSDTPQKTADSNKTVLTYPNGAQGLRNEATMQMEGDFVVVNLGNNEGYYAMSVESGKMLCKLHDYTISAFYKVSAENPLEGYGHFVFAFSELAENSAEEGPYVAFRANEQRFEVSTGGYNHEKYIMTGTPAKHDAWIHVLYRQNGTTGELFIDGVQVGINNDMPLLSDIFKSAPNNCWMGRAPFKGDKYLTNTQVANLQIFNYAVSNALLKELSKQMQ